MELSIENCGKISSADIIIDGITVIAGENNTGKSTVGKILFSLFNVMNNIDDRIMTERRMEILSVCRQIIREYTSAHNQRINVSKREYIVHNIADAIYTDTEKNIDRDNIVYIIETIYEKARITQDEYIEVYEHVVDPIAESIVEIIMIPENIILQEAVSRYFNNVFYGQINSLNSKDELSKIKVNIKGYDIELAFENNECTEYISNIDVINKAIYIDNPFVIDSINSHMELSIMDEFLVNLLIAADNKDIMDGIIESVMAKGKLEDINALLDDVVAGNILKESNDEYFLINDDTREAISFNNLSTGLKSFVLIKMLLEKNIIKNKDLLILDEPEIHLHPQWQVAYAELIVLIQKMFDLPIVVTTHSPYFVDAINIFSVKHGTDSKVNYYISKLGKNGAGLEMVTDNIDKIYEKMASPIQLLDTLRYELNN